MNKNNLEQHTFYFHDYETFGIHPSFDRPAQFAGVRTDMDFNIIDEPLVIYCKPSPDYLPNPEAVLLTGITPQTALQKGVCEAEFTQKIHREFSQANTCILGYNNIRFDDEVTRNILYRNFYDPYAYSWKNGNSRWDLLDLVRACYALRPEGINWPINEKNLPSFRLEHLTQANNIEHMHAHDAMSDVYATIAIAKLIKQKQPKLFDYFFNLRNKKHVADLIDVNSMSPLVHVSGMLGAHRGNTTWVAPIIWHPLQTNAVVTCDLAGDVDSLITLNEEEIATKLYIKNEDLDASESRIPLKLIHTNKCPIVAPAKTLLPENAARLSIDRSLCLTNLAKLRQHQDLIQEKLLNIYSKPTDLKEIKDVDGQIYQGFWSAYDKSLCQTILQTPPDLLYDLTITPNDERLKKLFFRYKARNYPQQLNEQEQQQWKLFCQEKLNHHILQDYLLQLEQFTQVYQSQPDKMELLKSLYHYCQYIANECHS